MLPPCTQGYFTFNVTTSIPHGEYSFVSCSLPFGWSWSPYIAQNTVESILRPITYLLPMIWVYIDDVLLAHSDPVFYWSVLGLLLAPNLLPFQLLFSGWVKLFQLMEYLTLSVALLNYFYRCFAPDIAVFVQSSGFWVLSSG